MPAPHRTDEHLPPDLDPASVDVLVAQARDLTPPAAGLEEQLPDGMQPIRHGQQGADLLGRERLAFESSVVGGSVRATTL
jgi:hypothetical protein